MIERICPECAAGNPVDAQHCTSCGCVLEEVLARRPGAALARSVPGLPVRWQRAGQAVALGVVALVVEAGAAWLQQRVRQSPAPLARTSPMGGGAFVARQRVWETYENGSLQRRVVEQTVWRYPEES